MTKVKLLEIILTAIIYVTALIPAYLPDEIMYISRCQSKQTTVGGIMSNIVVLLLIGSWGFTSNKIAKHIIQKLD